jgi:hypothetical protein
MTTRTPRTRNRSTAPLAPEEQAASNFLKLFKNVFSGQDFFIKYFETHDKAVTFKLVKNTHKRVVTEGKKSERELATALKSIMERKEPLSAGRVNESLDCRKIR